MGRESRAVAEGHSTWAEPWQRLSSMGVVSCSVEQQDGQKTCADGQRRVGAAVSGKQGDASLSEAVPLAQASTAASGGKRLH